jgi:rhodanese-related sulfurtransferase
MLADERGLNASEFYRQWRCADDAILIDIRTAGERQQASPLPGALYLDYLASDFERQLRQLDPYVPYFIYGDGGDRSRRACAAMLDRGFMLVYWLDGRSEELMG